LDPLGFYLDSVLNTSTRARLCNMRSNFPGPLCLDSWTGAHQAAIIKARGVRVTVREPGGLHEKIPPVSEYLAIRKTTSLAPTSPTTTHSYDKFPPRPRLLVHTSSSALPTRGKSPRRSQARGGAHRRRGRPSAYACSHDATLLTRK
jgi:hypothetical protein